MEVIRTPQATPKAEFITTTAELLKNSFTWHKTETAEDGTYINLYLTDTIYFQFESTTYYLKLIDTANNYSTNIQDFTMNYHNLTIFKVNEKCGAIAPWQGESADISYSKTIMLAFDTTNNNNGIAAIKPGTGSVSTIVDGIDNLITTSPTPYSSSTGYSINYIYSQMIPLINVKTGVKFDNIYGIIYSNVAMDNFVDFNNSKYFFSAGIGLPCGDGITYSTNMTT